MREIEFRAWDNQREQMFTSPKWVEFRFMRGVMSAVNYNRQGNEQQLLIMQYTGLKDANGVKIFEGDICKFRFNNKDVCGVVTYKGDQFIIDAPFGCWGKGLSGRPSKPEVIGNIHENPELLGG